MNCKQFEKRIKNVLDSRQADEEDLRQVVEHLRICRKCREKYHSVLEGDFPEHVVPEPSKIRIAATSPAEQDAVLSDPVEFKDKPITFSLLLDGREEPIKVIEPEFDLPIPEGSRLVVKDRSVSIADVRFGYKPDRQRPYTLHFRTRNRMHHIPPKVISFGPPGDNMRKVFKETLVKEGGVHAELEMTQGKARLHIRYQTPEH